MIVVGGSAGALSILQQIVEDFPENFPASVLVVLHIPPDAPSHLAENLDRAGPLSAAVAKNEKRSSSRESTSRHQIGICSSPMALCI